jgi:hypothetical protein
MDKGQVAVPKLTRDDEPSCSVLNVILNQNPMQTRNELLKSMHDARNGIDIRTPSNRRQKVGNVCEKPITLLAAEELGFIDVIEVINEPTRHKKCILNGSIDAIGLTEKKTMCTDKENGIYVPESSSVTIEGKGIMEIKITSARPEEKPVDYRGVTQVKGLMACTEYNWAVICIAYGTDLRYFFYQRDKQWEEEVMIPAVNDFVNRIDNLDYYSPFNTNEANQVFPKDNGSYIDLPDNAVPIFENIINAQNTIKGAKEIEESNKTLLMNMLGENQKGYIGKYEANWKTINYKAKPEQTKIIPAKDAYTQRRFSIKVHDES